MTFGEGISSSFISLIFNKEGLFFSSCMEAAKICLFDSLFVSFFPYFCFKDMLRLAAL